MPFLPVACYDQVSAIASRHSVVLHTSLGKEASTLDAGRHVVGNIGVASSPKDGGTCCSLFDLVARLDRLAFIIDFY